MTKPKPPNEKTPGTLGSTVPESDIAQRFKFVVETGLKIFGGSALTDSSQPIAQTDLDLIPLFFRREQGVAPTRPDAPWRLSALTNTDPRFNGPRPDGKPWRPVDGSYFGNWEAPAGPLEHIILAQKAGEFFTNQIKQHLRPDLADSEAQEMRSLSAKHAAAAAGLHDAGRTITHAFWSTDMIGGAALNEIGIREDLRRVMPREEVMQTPLDQSMDEVIENIGPEAVIVRLADEFGKRQPGTSHTYLVSGYEEWVTSGGADKWAETYTSRPGTGLKYETKFRENVQLHKDNVGRYFAALDKWIQNRTTLNLGELTTMFREHIDQTSPLPPLPVKK